MAINLSKVNISLQQFQEISSGKYNAGEVKLAGESRLAKMNNHVHQTSGNNEVVSHAEVLAVKAALVKALSDNGVAADEIDRIRRELGLAPDGARDRDLRTRSLKPLSRQQLREILDRNAATVNAFNAERPDGARIRTSADIYGRDGMAQDRREKRDAVNAQLADAKRKVSRSTTILTFQNVVADNVDFRDYERRMAIVKEAKAQLEALLSACGGKPREDVAATATLRLPGGQTIVSPTGMSEAAFAHQLEDQIIRLDRNTINDKREYRAAYRALKTPEERKAFFSALPDDKDGGCKARTIAVMILHERGVRDFAKLDVPNHLSDADAIFLAQHLSSLGDDVRGDALAREPLLVAMAAKPPKTVQADKRVFVPAVAAWQYNAYVKGALVNNPQDGLERFAILAAQTADEVRARLGAKGFPDGAKLGHLISSGYAAHIIDCGENAERVTPESLRAPFLQAALERGAQRMVEKLVEEELAAAGKDPDALADNVLLFATQRNPGLMRRLAASQTPAGAEGVLEEFRGPVREAIRIQAELHAARAGLEESALAAIAQKLGVPPEAAAAAGVETRYLKMKANSLLADIGRGAVKLDGPAEYKKAFDDLAAKFVRDISERLDAVDALDVDPATKTAVKLVLLTATKVKDIDIARLAAETAKIDVSALEKALRDGEPKERVFEAMHPVTSAIRRIVDDMLAGKDEVGPEDRDGPTAIMAKLLAGTRPGFGALLKAFYAKPETRDAVLRRRAYDVSNPARNSIVFECILNDPRIYRRADRENRVYEAIFAGDARLAAFKAAGGEQRAAAAGYHASELPMLAKAFGLCREATGCGDEAALAAALDPQSSVRRLAGYGGRFTQNAAAFADGLKLIQRFDGWYAGTLANVNDGNPSTITEMNLKTSLMSKKAARAVEKFLFEEIAANEALPLDAGNPEAAFGMENNRAMRFVGRNYTSSFANTLAQMSPERRGLIYDVVDAFDPISRDGRFVQPKHRPKPIDQNVILAARVLKNYDAVAALRDAGQLDRAHLVPLLYGDLGLAPDATNTQINDAYQARICENPLITGPLHMLLSESGATVDEGEAAINEGRKLPSAPDISAFNGTLEELDGTAAGGRAAMLGDLIRPSIPVYAQSGNPAIAEEDAKFTLHFPDGETLVAKTGPEKDAAVVQSRNAIAAKVEALCGTVHPKQLSAVYFALSQSATNNVKNGFVAQGINADEHMALTYSLAKDENTGAITVTYTPPAGFPVNFRWTATITLDGTTSTTPLATL